VHRDTEYSAAGYKRTKRHKKQSFGNLCRNISLNDRPPLPAGHHPFLAVALSAAIPTDSSPLTNRFPKGNHQSCSEMIPDGNIYFQSIPGGIASLNHRLHTDDALTGNIRLRRSAGKPPPAPSATRPP